MITPSDRRPTAGLYALDRESGMLEWAWDVEHGVGVDLVLAGERVLALTMTRELVALDLRTGKPAWTLAPDGRLEGRDVRQGTPALDGGRVFFETDGGRLYAAAAATGKLVWQRELGTDLTTSLLLTPDGLLAGLADGRLVRLDPATGEVEAALAVDGVPRGTLVREAGVLVAVLDPGDALVAVEESLARVLWRRDEDGRWTTPRPTLWRGEVLMGNEAGELWALGLRDGVPRWRRRFEGTLRGLGGAEEVLYVGTLAGRVYAYRR